MDDTNFEAISARLYPYNVPDSLIKIACADVGLLADEKYSSVNKVSVAKAAIDILKQLIILASESNGGYSLSYHDKLKERIYNLAKDNGLTDIADEFNPHPKIRFI